VVRAQRWSAPMRAERRRFLAAVGAGLAMASTRAAAPAPVVVTSFSILADIVANVAGNAAQVTSLVGPDADAHRFEARPSDVRRIGAAGLVVAHGLHFDDWLRKLVAAAATPPAVIVASDGVVPRLRGRMPDPHAWQDLANGVIYVENLRRALRALPGADAAAVDARAHAYRERLLRTDAAVRASLAAVPAAHRRVVTTHDAFGYFGAAYGVEFFAAQGWSTGSEPSAAAVAGLIRQVRRHEARAVFLENVTDPRLATEIARAGRVRVGGTLYSDALSAPGTAADTYVRMFEHNAAALVAALA